MNDPAAPRRRPLAIAVLLGLLDVTPHVRAEPSPAPTTERLAQARAYYDRARALVRSADYEHAAEEFRKAYETLPSFEVLYNLGQAYVALDRPVEALDALSRYLSDGGARVPGTRRAEVEQEIRELSAKTSTLSIAVEPSSAALELDGKPLDTAAPSRRLLPGKHSVAASAPGCTSQSLEIELVQGEARSLKFELLPLPAAPQLNGSVVITCDVPDVSVFVDGRIAATTPLQGPLAIATGEHVVSFERPGYRGGARRIHVDSAGGGAVHCVARPEVALDPALAAGLVVQISEPGASMRLDGLRYAGQQPIPAGKHHLAIERSGFERWQTDFVAPPGATHRIDARLVPTPEYARSYRASAERNRFIAYGIAGAGLGVGVAALVVFINNNQRYSQWSTQQQSLDQRWAAAAGTPESPDLRAAQDANDALGRSIQAHDTTTWILGIGAGALFAASAAVYWFSDSPNRYPTTGKGRARAPEPWVVRF